MPSAMVTFNGRITLPPDVRKQLGLRTGDSVEFVEIGNGRFAIAPGAGSISESVSESRAWIPELNFDPTEDEPRFMELDESIH
ncbi:MAG: AbrB/MazE/SpoVT family DNA-binding domain-containing protein [Terracidiphilus sp.]